MGFVFALAMAVAVGVAVALAWGRLRRLDREALVAAERERALQSRVGGSPERPVDIVSAAVVDARAVKEPCIDCGQSPVLEQHTADATEAGDRRVAHLRCPRCGMRWRMYFRLTRVEPA